MRIVYSMILVGWSGIAVAADPEPVDKPLGSTFHRTKVCDAIEDQVYVYSDGDLGRIYKKDCLKAER